MEAPLKYRLLSGSPWALSLVLCAPLLMGADGSGCGPAPAASHTGGTTADAGPGEAAVDLLLGSWTFRGAVPAIVTVTLTFNSDKTLAMVETVAPPTTPVGVSTSCITTDTYRGTYVEGIAGSTCTLDLIFTGGTANAVSGCDTDSPGTAMNAQSIAANRGEGLVPAATNTYAVTTTTLVLTPVPDDSGYVGLAFNPTTFSRQQSADGGGGAVDTSVDASGGSADALVDSAVRGDGGFCIDIDPSSFDTSCSVDSDCIGIYAGQLCDGYSCSCPSATISASGQAAYNQVFSSVTPSSGGLCSCPALISPRCAQGASGGVCTACPNPAFGGSIPPGCPDAG